MAFNLLLPAYPLDGGQCAAPAKPCWPPLTAPASGPWFQLGSGSDWAGHSVWWCQRRHARFLKKLRFIFYSQHTGHSCLRVRFGASLSKAPLRLWRCCARSIFADLMLLCGVPAVLAAKIMVGVALTIGVAIIVFGGVYFSVITMIARPYHTLLECDVTSAPAVMP